MRRALHDPRIRAVLAIALSILALVLAWHQVGMGLHGAAMMLGACLVFAALRGAGPWRPRPVVPIRQGAWQPAGRVRSTDTPPAPGRHPPDDGVVLRH